MELHPMPVNDELHDRVYYGNFDGVPVTPYKIVPCPHCHSPAVIVQAYLGGYGKHHAYRCLLERDHQGPVLAMDGYYLTAEYVHDRYSYNIIPALIVLRDSDPVAISASSKARDMELQHA